MMDSQALTDSWQRWANDRRVVLEKGAAYQVSANEAQFQGLGMTVIQMIDQIRREPQLDAARYNAMRQVIIQQLFEIWSLDREVKV
ncbi:hypothetical protein ACS4RR_020925 [Rhizobium sp. Z1P35]